MSEKMMREASARLHALALFRGLLEDEVISKFLAYLDGQAKPRFQCTDLYCAFVSALYERGGDLGAVLTTLVLESENPAVRCFGARCELAAEMKQSLDTELAALSFLTTLAPADIARGAGGDALPSFQNTRQDFKALYTRRLAEVETRGYGIFAAYHMFTLDDRGAPKGVKNPDPQRISDLTGYEREREQLLINTRALLKGLPAGNILLYGDAGTGKSSTVKAIGNEYKDRGLRLVEVRKNQIFHIPDLMDKLADNPLKFILFIDDISFPDNDADFTALKAILEGNVSARPANIVVYATSNRRHMVRERFADRTGDELHTAETLEEEASLAARFGLTITFLKPDREMYATIVKSLAREYNLRTPDDELVAKAEAHAIRYGGRSPRIARQFVEFVKATEEDGMGARRGEAIKLP